MSVKRGNHALFTRSQHGFDLLRPATGAAARSSQRTRGNRGTPLRRSGGLNGGSFRTSTRPTSNGRKTQGFSEAVEAVEKPGSLIGGAWTPPSVPEGTLKTVTLHFTVAVRNVSKPVGLGKSMPMRGLGVDWPLLTEFARLCERSLKR